MEQNHNVLALVREGKIEEAAHILATKKHIQWPSLPGGEQSRGFANEKMILEYNKFLKDLV